MSSRMVPASVGGSCRTIQPSDKLSRTGPPSSLITPGPPPELVAQELRKRAEATCGFSGTDLYTCPLNSYCIYSTDNGRWDCCSVSSDSSVASTCDPTATVCYGSSAASSAFPAGTCGDGIACCWDYPDCITAILLVDDSQLYSSFFCGQTDATVYVTPFSDYTSDLASTSTATIVTTSVQPAPTVTSISTSITISTTSEVPPTPSTLTHTQIESVTVTMTTTSSPSSTKPFTTSSLSSTTPSPPTRPTSSFPSTVTDAAASTGAPANAIAASSHTSQSTFRQHESAIIGGSVAGAVILFLIALAFFIRHRMAVKRQESGMYGRQEMSGRVVSDGTVYSRVPGNGYEY